MCLKHIISDFISGVYEANSDEINRKLDKIKGDLDGCKNDLEELKRYINEHHYNDNK